MRFNKQYAQGGQLPAAGRMMQALGKAQQGGPNKPSLTELTPQQQQAYDAQSPEMKSSFLDMVTKANEKTLLKDMTNAWEDNVGMEDQTAWRGNYSDEQLSYFDEYMNEPAQPTPQMAQGGRFKITKKKSFEDGGVNGDPKKDGDPKKEGDKGYVSPMQLLQLRANEEGREVRGTSAAPSYLSPEGALTTAVDETRAPTLAVPSRGFNVIKDETPPGPMDRMPSLPPHLIPQRRDGEIVTRQQEVVPEDPKDPVFDSGEGVDISTMPTYNPRSGGFTGVRTMNASTGQKEFTKVDDLPDYIKDDETFKALLEDANSEHVSHLQENRSNRGFKGGKASQTLHDIMTGKTTLDKYKETNIHAEFKGGGRFSLLKRR